MGLSLRELFLKKLEEKYGPWDQVTSRFGTTKFGRISSDLSISASQFSKLISGTATEGMYQRSIKNIDRLIEQEKLQGELLQLREENHKLRHDLGARSTTRTINRNTIYIAAFMLIMLALLALLLNLYNRSSDQLLIDEHPLSTYFDQEYSANFNAPYVDLEEVQEFCPCSAFEGKWELNKPYQLPLPGSRRPGLYYLAKSADVRMKCSRIDTAGPGKGKVLSAYEYLVNEIWLDTEMTPLSPKYFDPARKVFTPAFKQLKFTENDNFKKVATIHSFFIDRFELAGDYIARKGEPCGRFATDVNEKLTDEYEIDIKYILENVLANLTTTQCAPTSNLYCNPNELNEGESVISFECTYTIDSENLGMGGGYPYTKGYKLVQQNYADNLLCNCND